MSTVNKRVRAKRRVRRNIFGTASKPRLSIFRSNKQIYGQIINDEDQKTLISFSSLKTGEESGTKIEQAYEVGKKLAEEAVSNGIEEVIFDRNGYVYHGRIKSFGDGAREGGLKF